MGGGDKDKGGDDKGIAPCKEQPLRESGDGGTFTRREPGIVDTHRPPREKPPAENPDRKGD